MIVIKFIFLLFFNILYVTDGDRRIKDGREVLTDKRYVVYLVKAPKSNRIYDEWLCGGALVSSSFIITSAACVNDVEYMYAIAGYKKYVPDTEIDENDCTKEKKKKITYVCIPMKYELDYKKTEVWSFIDIALAQVESPYDFTDATYRTLCSYIPAAIPINYENRFQKPGTDTLVYGWGHLEKWRQEGDFNNYNQPNMRYAASKILEKTECKKHYEAYKDMGMIIDTFMICALKEGEFTDKGELKLLNGPSPKVDGCLPTQSLKGPELPGGELALNNSMIDDCPDEFGQDFLKDATRRKDENTNHTSSDFLQNKNRTDFNRTTVDLRKNGICQNDHGGPLVTWVGGNEILIGIASVFKVSDDLKCMGPYLYTSTQCNGAFIDCALNMANTGTRRSICNSAPVKRGYDTVERNISWLNHPAGPADNEKNMQSAAMARAREVQSPETAMKFALLSKLVKDQENAILRPHQRLYRPGG